MVIGQIERLLSHFGAAHTVDSKAFITALLRDVHSILPNPDQICIDVQADSTEISSTTAIALGALLVELINNALKHAFREGMEGTLAVRFIVSKSKPVVIYFKKTKIFNGLAANNRPKNSYRCVIGTREPRCAPGWRPAVSSPWR
jgi:two-component sensor histidine kinase